MEISDLSKTHNIPIKNIIDFFGSQKIRVHIGLQITQEQQQLFEDNIQNIQAEVEVENIAIDILEDPVKSVKINLSQSTATGNNKAANELTRPRLMAAAKFFNIGKDTLVEFLLSRGFDKNELSPLAKLTEEMYLALKQEFSSDKIAKFKSSLIELPNKNINDYNFFRGQISEVINQNKIKIHYLKSEKVEKNGKVSYVDIVDLKNWVFALKDDWRDYNFKIGEKINFVLKEVFREGRKMTIAMPPVNVIGSVQPKHENSKITGAFKLDTNHDEKNSNKEVHLNYDYSNSKENIPNNIFNQLNNLATDKMNTKITPMQKILFGSPGTGKSHTIDGSGNSYLRQLDIVNKSLDCIKTVFHPEYTYGDFMGKLMPNTNDDGGVEYRFYAGHFLKTLGRAYKNIILAKIECEKEKDEVEKVYKREINKTNKRDFSDAESEELQRRRVGVPATLPQNVALVIDEINRGNSAAIFGTTFQLLDRDANGWSSYHVRISDMENNKLLEEISLEYKEYKKGNRIDKVSYTFDNNECTETEYKRYLDFIFEDLHFNEQVDLTRRDIKLPPNLSIIATMNTSDNSIYFMDSAFKRRWDWEFIDITSDEQKLMQSGRKLEDGYAWDEFVDNLNSFIKKYGERIRKIEDKQIGYYFIKGDVIKHEAIKNKLMFFLWDSIFNNDKKPLKELIGMDKTLVTFGDFIRHYDVFISAIKNKTFSPANVL